MVQKDKKDTPQVHREEVQFWRIRRRKMPCADLQIKKRLKKMTESTNL